MTISQKLEACRTHCSAIARLLEEDPGQPNYKALYTMIDMIDLNLADVIAEQGRAGSPEIEEEKRRTAFINTISSLFPGDSHYDETRAVAQRFVVQAITRHWRELPIEVLKTYATLCSKHEEENL